MRYKLARVLQLIGLILLPIGIAGNLARPEQVNLATSLKISVTGMVVFFVGWLLQKGTHTE